MYDTTIVCTYNTEDIFLESDIISDEDKFFIRNAIYRQELLNIFGLSEYNNHDMNEALLELYDRVKECDDINKCITGLAIRFLRTNDNLFGLIVMFSYESMDLSHICISEFLETGKITELHMRKLEESLMLEDILIN
jgi:hypothetical protein